MILCGADSLREVIAFPKTQRAICPITGAPGAVSAAQLKELGIKVVE
jgi:aspartyl-tRNA synthetase